MQYTLAPVTLKVILKVMLKVVLKAIWIVPRIILAVVVWPI